MQKNPEYLFFLVLGLTIGLSALAQHPGTTGVHANPPNQRLVDGSADLFNWIIDANVDDLKKATPASEMTAFGDKKGYYTGSVFDLQVEPDSYAGDLPGEFQPNHAFMYEGSLFSEVAVKGNAPLDPCFSTLGALNAILNPKGGEKKQYVNLRHLYERKDIKIASGANAPGIISKVKKQFVSYTPDELREPGTKKGDPYMSITALSESLSGRTTSAEDLQERGAASGTKILQSFDFCASRVKANPTQAKRWENLGNSLPNLRKQVVDLLHVAQGEGKSGH